MSKLRLIIALCVCSWSQCNDGYQCSKWNLCVPKPKPQCGGDWQPCCSGSKCSSDKSVCSGDKCMPCGGEGQPTCAGAPTSHTPLFQRRCRYATCASAGPADTLSGCVLLGAIPLQLLFRLVGMC